MAWQQIRVLDGLDTLIVACYVYVIICIYFKKDLGNYRQIYFINAK